ncbi:ABC transporter substrate-binding protein [Calditrichota bacterium]
MKKKYYFIIAGVIVIAAILYFVLTYKDLTDKIILPYIAHQKPVVDPHLPHSVPLSDKLDEVLYDGLFNISANPSGITYEDGLGELLNLDENNVLTIRLKPKKKWHSSYNINSEDDEVTVVDGTDVYFTADDLRFTLRRIKNLGSRSPDYILISQAIEPMDFDGPDKNNEIRFKFKDDRVWTESDIKEVLSFKILPYDSEINASYYPIGSGPYMTVDRQSQVSNYYKSPAEKANITNVILKPFIDNSTFITEFKNENINVLLGTPFGSLSSLLNDKEVYFAKSNISTTFFALLFNTTRLNRNQRISLRNLINSKIILNRFFKIGSEQQRHIKDYKGNTDNYEDYLNYSIFPTSSYYVDEEIIVPPRQTVTPDISVLADTIRIQCCLNYGFREEFTDIINVLNDRSLFKGKIKATAVTNDELKKGNYDAVLIAITGYRSNFLFDFYNIFLREPDLANYKINLKVNTDGSVNNSSFSAAKNFFRLDASVLNEDQEDIIKLLDYIYGFMSTREVGDRQAYAGFIDQTEQELALGKWLFSLPSLAYFNRQFDESTIDLYGVASQLSTIEKWQEKMDE